MTGVNHNHGSLAVRALYDLGRRVDAVDAVAHSLLLLPGHEVRLVQQQLVGKGHLLDCAGTQEQMQGHLVGRRVSSFASSLLCAWVPGHTTVEHTHVRTHTCAHTRAHTHTAMM